MNGPLAAYHITNGKAKKILNFLAHRCGLGDIVFSPMDKNASNGSFIDILNVDGTRRQSSLMYRQAGSSLAYCTIDSSHSARDIYSRTLDYLLSLSNNGEYEILVVELESLDVASVFLKPATSLEEILVQMDLESDKMRL